MFVIALVENPTKLFFNSKENIPIVLCLNHVFIINLPLFNLAEGFFEAEVYNIPENQRHIMHLHLGQTHFHK